MRNRLKNNKQEITNKFTKKIIEKITKNEDRIVELYSKINAGKKEINAEKNEDVDMELLVEFFELKGFNDGLEFGVELLYEFNKEIYENAMYGFESEDIVQ